MNFKSVQNFQKLFLILVNCTTDLIFRRKIGSRETSWFNFTEYSSVLVVIMSQLSSFKNNYMLRNGENLLTQNRFGHPTFTLGDTN